MTIWNSLMRWSWRWMLENIPDVDNAVCEEACSIGTFTAIWDYVLPMEEKFARGKRESVLSDWCATVHDGWLSTWRQIAAIELEWHSHPVADPFFKIVYRRKLMHSLPIHFALGIHSHCGIIRRSEFLFTISSYCGVNLRRLYMHMGVI